MKIYSLDPSKKKADERRIALLEVLEEMRKHIESGNIQEFVACSIDVDNVCKIHASALDLPGAIGLFEIGKHMMIQADGLEDVEDT